MRGQQIDGLDGGAQGREIELEKYNKMQNINYASKRLPKATLNEIGGELADDGLSDIDLFTPTIATTNMK